MGPHKHIPVVGVVGGIGSGKSTVAAEFQRLGCSRIDCDKLAHALLTDADVKREIRKTFGAKVFDEHDEISRPAVAEIVFRDSEKLDALEQILHPRIREKIIERIDAARQTDSIAVVVDAAVLFEAGWDDLCTVTMFVEAPEEDRLERVRKSRGWDRDALQTREARQIPLDKKARRCHYNIHNHSSVSRLKEQVRQFLHHITRE